MGVRRIPCSIRSGILLLMSIPSCWCRAMCIGLLCGGSAHERAIPSLLECVKDADCRTTKNSNAPECHHSACKSVKRILATGFRAHPLVWLLPISMRHHNKRIGLQCYHLVDIRICVFRERACERLPYAPDIQCQEVSCGVRHIRVLLFRVQGDSTCDSFYDNQPFVIAPTLTKGKVFERYKGSV